MKIDVYRKIVEKNKAASVFAVLEMVQKEFLFSIESNVVPQIGEKLFIDTSGEEFKVISVKRVLSEKTGKTFNSEYFIIEVESAILSEAKTLDHLCLAVNGKQ